MNLPPERAVFDAGEKTVWILPLVVALAFGFIWLGGYNRAAFLLLNDIGVHTGDTIWAQLTILGDTVVALALCLPLWRRRGDLMWALAIGAVLSTLWVHGIKPLVSIDRPPAVLGDLVHVIGPAHRRHAFPSGHATTAFAVAGLYALGLRTRLAFVLAVTIAVLAALSRSVVGVHWPLDILAGAFGGWLSAVLALRLARSSSRFGAQPLVQWAAAIALGGCALALVLGYKTGYESLMFQRVLGVLCLAAAAWTFVRHERTIDSPSR